MISAGVRPSSTTSRSTVFWRDLRLSRRRTRFHEIPYRYVVSEARCGSNRSPCCISVTKTSWVMSSAVSRDPLICRANRYTDLWCRRKRPANASRSPPAMRDMRAVSPSGSGVRLEVTSVVIRQSGAESSMTVLTTQPRFGFERSERLSLKRPLVAFEIVSCDTWASLASSARVPIGGFADFCGTAPPDSHFFSDAFSRSNGSARSANTARRILRSVFETETTEGYDSIVGASTGG